MNAYGLSVGLAAVLCSLVTGFLFAFAVVVMPGLKALPDRSFIRGFQVIDGVIQNGQPLFLVVWVGSVLALLTAVGMGVAAGSGVDRTLLIACALVYLLGVQLPTMAVNVPLNNQLQAVSAGDATELQAKEARDRFENRWNTANVIRTICAVVCSVVLIVMCLKL